MVHDIAKRGALLGLIVLVGLTVATAPAVAQTEQAGGETNTELQATPPTEPIRPLSGLVTIPLEVTYTYQAGGAAFVTTPISLEVADKPSWVTATVSPSTVFIPVEQDPEPGASYSQSKTTQIVVQTTAQAPAFQQGNIQIEGTAESNGNLDSSSGTTSVPVQAGFFSIIDAQTPKPVVIAGPQEQIDFPVEVTNFGNGDQTIFLDTAQATEDLDIVLPGAFTVSAKQTGAEDNTRTVTVSVQTPFQNGYINQPGTFSLDVSSAYALDQSEEGMSTRISSLITTKGFFVPGPGTAAAIFAMAGVGLALSRRRDL